MDKRFRFAIDRGGTFTDIYCEIYETNSTLSDTWKDIDPRGHDIDNNSSIIINDKPISRILKLLSEKIKVIRPLSYKQAIYYLKYAKLLITDSGGIQKEAFFAKTQALTIREETERPEIICAKWNRLVKPKKSSIYNIAKKYISSKGNSSKRYGNGKTEKLILKKS